MPTKIKAKIEIEAISKENAVNIANLLQNIAITVTEKDLMSLWQNVSKDKNFFANIVSKLDNPLVKQFLG